MHTDTRHFWALLALLLLLAFTFQGTRGIWEPDEGRYTSGGINMLRSGDWLVPTIDAEHPHLTKPPMTYWALAASFGALGANEWAARLPAALAFVGTGLLRVRARTPARAGEALAAARRLVAVVCAVLRSQHRHARTALLVLFETAAMWAFVEAWCAGARVGAAGSA